jgi:NAD(P)-dependent dehydrogenase (short-subunit alcohol dehydrogenase family)
MMVAGLESMMRLKGKVAVITGAGSGIGRAAAELFAREKAVVVLGDLNTAGLDEVVAGIQACGGEAVGLKSNVANREEAEALVNLAVSHFGRVDILVNNAGVMDYFHPVGTLEDEVWERVIAVNLTGTMYMSRRAAQVMLENGGGSIVNLSSRAGLVGSAAGAAYTTSKHGVVGLTRSTAWQYAEKGIRCNAICPGGVHTNIVSERHMALSDPEGVMRMGMVAPMPALLEAIDIANLALFLASDESRHINGAIIPADAGWSAS